MWKILTLTGLCLISCVNAFASGAIWVNREELKKVSSVAILPVEGQGCFGHAQNFMQENFAKRNKDTKFVVVPGNEGEPQEVAQRYGANAYIIGYMRENSVRQDWSPELDYAYTQHSYNEEQNGPKGTFRFNERQYSTVKYFPGRYVDMNKVNMDFVMYNTQGEVIMTMQDRNYGYGDSAEALTKAIIKEMAISWRDAKKETKSPVSFECKEVRVPSSKADDSFLTMAIEYATENESTKFKKIPSSSNYYVTANVTTYEEDWKWIPPNAYTNQEKVSSKAFKWKETITKPSTSNQTYQMSGESNRPASNNKVVGAKTEVKERTGYINRYETVPKYIEGHYEVKGRVMATLNLVDARTKQIVITHTADDVHSKEIDSYREIVREFYKKVQRNLK